MLLEDKVQTCINRYPVKEKSISQQIGGVMKTIGNTLIVVCLVALATLVIMPEFAAASTCSGENVMLCELNRCYGVAEWCSSYLCDDGRAS